MKSDITHDITTHSEDTLTLVSQQQIAILKRISYITLSLLLFSFILAYCIGEIFIAAGFGLLTILLLTVLVLNFLNKYFISKSLLSITPALSTIFFPFIEFNHIEHSYAILLGSMVFFVYPFILIDYTKEKIWFFVISGVNLAFVLGHDVFYAIISENPWNTSSWLLIKIPQVFMFLLMITAFILIQDKIIRYQDSLKNANFLLQEANQSLQDKNQKIKAQASQILTQSREISNQNKSLTKCIEQSVLRGQELKASHDTLQQNKEEIQAILETLAVRETEMTSIMDAIYIHVPITEFDLQGNVTSISYKIAQVFDIKPDDLIGKNITEFVHNAQKKATAEDIEMIHQFWKTIIEGTPQSRESEFTVNKKSLCFTETFVPILDEKGNPSKVISVGQDVTETYRQRNKIERQNSRIQESMRAALKIQLAILPNEDYTSKLFKEYFLIYNAKDVVSGDFYHVERIDEGILIIVADCTGHGVPGAFMTMIGIIMIKKILHVEEVTEPAQILSLMNHSVRIALRQRETGDRNGMDMSVAVIKNTQENNYKVIFAGAKHYLTHVDANQNVQTFEGVRKSIGGRQNNNKSFSSNEFTCTSNSMVYLTTDGFEDQNSLVGRERFGKKRFVALLQEIAPHAAYEQKKRLQRALSDHMKGTTQRDDILVMGIRL